jgi:hypothetical protein
VTERTDDLDEDARAQALIDERPDLFRQAVDAYRSMIGAPPGAHPPVQQMPDDLARAGVPADLLAAFMARASLAVAKEMSGGGPAGSLRTFARPAPSRPVRPWDDLREVIRLEVGGKVTKISRIRLTQTDSGSMGMVSTSGGTILHLEGITPRDVDVNVLRGSERAEIVVTICGCRLRVWGHVTDARASGNPIHRDDVRSLFDGAMHDDYYDCSLEIRVTRMEPAAAVDPRSDRAGP